MLILRNGYVDMSSLVVKGSSTGSSDQQYTVPRGHYSPARANKEFTPVRPTHAKGMVPYTCQDIRGVWGQVQHRPAGSEQARKYACAGL